MPSTTRHPYRVPREVGRADVRATSLFGRIRVFARGYGGRLYAASEDGDVYVVKAGPTFELLATNKMGEVVIATPAIADGMLIIRGLSRVIAVGE